jgi:hypothetical protein
MYTQQFSPSSEKKIEKNQTITFPVNGTVGFSFVPFERWIIGGDLDYINWKSGYKLNGLPVKNMENNFRLGAGIERTPSPRRLASYGDRVNYRAGVFFGQLNYLSNDKPVNEYGFSLGFGLPIRSGRSRIDIALLAGQRGDIALNGLSEKFFRMSISISANELWFQNEDR